jgi:hypothetical protein
MVVFPTFGRPTIPIFIVLTSPQHRDMLRAPGYRMVQGGTHICSRQKGATTPVLQALWVGIRDTVRIMRRRVFRCLGCLPVKTPEQPSAGGNIITGFSFKAIIA